MNVSASRQEAVAAPTPSRGMDRAVQSLIVGVGVLCFAMLLWVHLGLGALIMPPAATSAQQTAMAGPYAVAFTADSGQLTAGSKNQVSFVVRDAAGHAVDNATVTVQPVMTTMSMANPAASVQAAGAGKYVAHPDFAMAGTWRLEVTIAQSGATVQHTSFLVSVRWP